MMKTTKMKMVGLMLALIICLGLIACNNIKPLSSEKEIQIKQDYLSEYGHEFYYSDFYGDYNGSAVFFIEGINEMVKNITISGVEFKGNHAWTILVWNDGSFYNLEDIDKIFELNILTQRNLRQIGQIHSKNRK